MVDGFQVQLHDMELHANRKPFSSDANLAVMQPGTARTTQPGQPPTPQPEPVPTPPAR